MSDAKNTGPSLRDMAYRAAGGGRKSSSSNALVNAANKVFASYADQMADEALKRKADPNYRDRLRAARLSKAADRLEQQAGETKREKRKERLLDKSKRKRLKSDNISLNLPPLPSQKDASSTTTQFDNFDNIMGLTIGTGDSDYSLTTSANKMRSPIKQSLFGAAKAAAGGNRRDTKNISEFISGLASAAIEARKATQRVLKDKVTKALEDFSPEVVDLEGFNGFMNGKNAVTNFGINLKQKIAEKKDAALKLNPYSMEYKETMAEINSLVESTKNLNMEKMRLTNLKKEWGTSSKTNLYSKGSSKITMNYLKQVMSRDVAPMTLDENGKVQFEVLKVDSNGDPMVDADGGALTEIISFDDLNKDLYLKVELDVAPQIADYHAIIRKNHRDRKGFNRDANKTFWNTLIAPDEDSVNFDGELLSWIHDTPYNLYKGNKSFYSEFVDYFKGKTLAIGEGGEPVVMDQNAIDALFNTDTRDWDVELVAGTNANGQPIIKTVREYIREELVNYYARTSEQYYYDHSNKQDITRSTIGKSIEETNVNREFAE